MLNSFNKAAYDNNRSSYADISGIASTTTIQSIIKLQTLLDLLICSLFFFICIIWAEQGKGSEDAEPGGDGIG